MEMNKYLIAALYVFAGCVATLPIGVRAGNVPVANDSYRLLISSPTEKIITVCTDKRTADDLDYGVFSHQNYLASIDSVKVYYTYSPLVLPGWKVPEVTANPLRAPGRC